MKLQKQELLEFLRLQAGMESIAKEGVDFSNSSKVYQWSQDNGLLKG